MSWVMSCLFVAPPPERDFLLLILPTQRTSCLKLSYQPSIFFWKNHGVQEGELRYSDTPLSEFKTADTYVSARGGVEALDDDEDDQ